MKSKKSFFFNYRVLFFALISLLLILFGILVLLPLGKSIEQVDIGISIVLLLFGALFLLGAILLVPQFCVVDETGIKILYIFGLLSVQGDWTEIRKIYEEIEFLRSLLFSHSYVFVGTHSSTKGGKSLFFMESSFPKTKRLTKILKHYAKCPLTGI